MGKTVTYSCDGCGAQAPGVTISDRFNEDPVIRAPRDWRKVHLSTPYNEPDRKAEVCGACAVQIEVVATARLPLVQPRLDDED